MIYDREYQDFLKIAEDYIFLSHEPKKADIIFVPGNGYPQMAEHAAKLYRQGYAPLVMPCGRYSITVGHFGGVWDKQEQYNGDYETEWDFLKDVLLKNGVPKEAILKENQSTYTYENAINARKVTDAAGMDIKRAIICCKYTHARRAYMYFREQFPETELLVCPCEAGGITRENWKTTRNGIEEVTGEISRVIYQFQMLM